MKYFKLVIDGYIISISKSKRGQTEITKQEYLNIKDIILHRPEPPEGYDYRLKDVSLEWELYELPPEDEEEPNDT